MAKCLHSRENNQLKLLDIRLKYAVLISLKSSRQPITHVIPHTLSLPAMNSRIINLSEPIINRNFASEIKAFKILVTEYYNKTCFKRGKQIYIVENIVRITEYKDGSFC